MVPGNLTRNEWLLIIFLGEMYCGWFGKQQLVPVCISMNGWLCKVDTFQDGSGVAFYWAPGSCGGGCECVASTTTTTKIITTITTTTIPCEAGSGASRDTNDLCVCPPPDRQLQRGRVQRVHLPKWWRCCVFLGTRQLRGWGVQVCGINYHHHHREQMCKSRLLGAWRLCS
jgi:hypothetical protein